MSEDLAHFDPDDNWRLKRDLRLAQSAQRASEDRARAAEAKLLDLSKVTRLTVADHRRHTDGRVASRRLEVWGVKLELVLQDSGRTLKVFIDDGEDA